jgi:hypothetical protein
MTIIFLGTASTFLSMTGRVDWRNIFSSYDSAVGFF